MSSEHDIISKLDVVYENRVVHEALVVLGDDCDVDVERLERLMQAKNFPLSHTLFVTWVGDLEYDTKLPDVVVVKSKDPNVYEQIIRRAKDQDALLVFI